jgi:hypothetical protein
MVTIQRIKESVAREFGVSVNELDSPRRTHQVVVARFAAYYLCKKMTKCSFPTIAFSFRRDHTTVLTGVRKAEKMIIDDEVFASRVAQTRAAINEVPDLSPEIEQFQILLDDFKRIASLCGYEITAAKVAA